MPLDILEARALDAKNMTPEREAHLQELMETDYCAYLRENNKTWVEAMRPTDPNELSLNWILGDGLTLPEIEKLEKVCYYINFNLQVLMKS